MYDGFNKYICMMGFKVFRRGSFHECTDLQSKSPLTCFSLRFIIQIFFFTQIHHTYNFFWGMNDVTKGFKVFRRGSFHKCTDLQSMSPLLCFSLRFCMHRLHIYRRMYIDTYYMCRYILYVYYMCRHIYSTHIVCIYTYGLHI